MNLENTIKTHRKKANLSREKLAELAGVGKTVIFDIEHGKKTIQLDTLKKILTILNIKLIVKGPLMKEELEI